MFCTFFGKSLLYVKCILLCKSLLCVKASLRKNLLCVKAILFCKHCSTEKSWDILLCKVAVVQSSAATYLRKLCQYKVVLGRTLVQAIVVQSSTGKCLVASFASTK